MKIKKVTEQGNFYRIETDKGTKRVPKAGIKTKADIHRLFEPSLEKRVSELEDE